MDQQTAGELQYRQYGLTGIRGEAQAGYPTVFDHGLPTMLATAGEWNRRIIQTMLALARYTEDSTLVKRAGDPAILEWKTPRWTHVWRRAGLRLRRAGQSWPSWSRSLLLST